MHSLIETEESSKNFKFVSEDIIDNIFSRLEEDPRHLARLACVCQRFLHVVRHVCWKRHCVRFAPELLPSPRVHLDAMAPPPGGWAGLMKLLVCCPGLRHAGVLLECWDFGLERELGSSAQYMRHRRDRRKSKRTVTGCQGEGSGEAKDCHTVTGISYCTDLYSDVGLGQQRVELLEDKVEKSRKPTDVESCQETDTRSGLNLQFVGKTTVPGNFKEVEHGNLVAKGKQLQSSWSSNEVAALGIDDIRAASSRKRKEISGDTTQENASIRELPPCLAVHNFDLCLKSCSLTNECKKQESIIKSEELRKQGGPLVTLSDHARVREASQCANACIAGASNETEKHLLSREGDREFKPVELHLASGAWNLSREQGNKLLASRFRADCLYICDWPGCEHPGERRKYKLFRGIFKNFRSSHVWRNLKDMKSKPVDVPCAFCNSACSWDLMTAFCLRRSLEYHDDGEPVVRAYVCENGHVSGAWTDRPLYTL